MKVFHNTKQSIRLLLESAPSEMGRRQRLVATNLRVVLSVARLSVISKLKLHAQALTYDTLLALVPLLAVVFAIFNAFGGLERMRVQVEAFVISNISGSPEVEAMIGEYLQKFIGNIHTGG
ncbi:YihY/virulence factor BrkB family protein, partial [Myxococcota bacterium]|nr:YihY/virulence factor BrkB family protein [Myxococcota bacterium]